MREKLASPFRKLRNYALSTKSGSKVEASSEIGGPLLTGVGLRMQDTEDMRSKFEGFLTSGQMISGAAYDFSRALQDMASYMMEAFGDVLDEEAGNSFGWLAKVQFEISKLLDLFAAHVSETIIKPTETLMTNMQQAATFKDRYDEKRKLYIVTQIQKQKERLRRGKNNRVKESSMMAREGLKEQANTLDLYMQSLIQKQSESLVTQVVKYHSAQVHLFSKSLASINAVEPMMRKLALEKGIDRQVSKQDMSTNGFLSDLGRGGKTGGSTIDSETDSMASPPRRSSVEQIDFPRYSSESSEEFPRKRTALISKSAPISPLMNHKRKGHPNESLFDNAHIMYALPSPFNGSGRWVESKTGTRSQNLSNVCVQPACFPTESWKPNYVPEGSGNAGSETALHRKIKEQFAEMQHRGSQEIKATPSKPLKFFVKDTEEDHLRNLSKEKPRRYTQSGPLIDSAWTLKNSRRTNTREASSAAIPINHLLPLYKSGPISASPMYPYTTCDLSPPPSVPQISELHKLPLPPAVTITPP